MPVLKQTIPQKKALIFSHSALIWHLESDCSLKLFILDPKTIYNDQIGSGSCVRTYVLPNFQVQLGAKLVHTGQKLSTKTDFQYLSKIRKSFCQFSHFFKTFLNLKYGCIWWFWLQSNPFTMHKYLVMIFDHKYPKPAIVWKYVA